MGSPRWIGLSSPMAMASSSSRRAVSSTLDAPLATPPSSCRAPSPTRRWPRLSCGRRRKLASTPLEGLCPPEGAGREGGSAASQFARGQAYNPDEGAVGLCRHPGERPLQAGLLPVLETLQAQLLLVLETCFLKLRVV